MTKQEYWKKQKDKTQMVEQNKADLQSGKLSTIKDKEQKILDKIDFEEKWLLDVFRNENKISLKDVEIAMSAIRHIVKEKE